MSPSAAIVAVLAALACPAAGLAADHRGTGGSLAMVVAAWVSEATGLPMPATLPDIRFAESPDMPALMGAIASSPPQSGDTEVIAFYDSSARAIYLPTGWTGTTPAEIAVLVHEMVHHAQASAGRRFACPGERERQAYDAQARWLAQFGTDLTREFGISAMFLLIATTCGMP